MISPLSLGNKKKYEFHTEISRLDAFAAFGALRSITMFRNSSIRSKNFIQVSFGDMDKHHTLGEMNLISTKSMSKMDTAFYNAGIFVSNR